MNDEITVKTVEKKLGRARIAARVGVNDDTVRVAVDSGVFPSAWYMTMKSMGREKRFRIPERLFNWKAADPPKHLPGQP